MVYKEYILVGMLLCQRGNKHQNEENLETAVCNSIQFMDCGFNSQATVHHTGNIPGIFSGSQLSYITDF